MARKKTLSEELNAMAAPKVKDYDIEDEETAFQNESEEDGSDASESEEESKREHYVKTDKSKLRDTTINLGSKYVGSKASRNEIFDSVNQGGSSEEEEDDDDDDDDDDNDDVDDDESLGSEDDGAMDSEEFEIGSDNEGDDSDILKDVTDSEEEDDESEGSGEESDDNDMTEEEKYKRSQLSKLLSQEKKSIVTRLSTSAKSDALKGYSVLQQHKLFDKILDSRIKLQKAMAASNQLPLDKKTFDEFKSKSSASKIEESSELLKELLGKIINLRAKLYNDEEITKTEVKVNLKKRSLDNFLQETNKLDTILGSYKKNVLVKWSNKVQLASGSTALNSSKFKTINQNINVQVENNLQDMDRLVKRTRLNRRNITPLGYTAPKQDANEDAEDDNDDETSAYGSNMDSALQAQAHIFDDDDFYRVLLNDMVDKKIADKQSMSSAAIITLTKNKIHKNYDRKATKGRKLNYKVQEPLAHFEVPKSKTYAWNDDQIDELFASLLGQKVSMNENSDDENDSDDEQAVGVTVKNTGISLFS